MIHFQGGGGGIWILDQPRTPKNSGSLASSGSADSLLHSVCGDWSVHIRFTCYQGVLPFPYVRSVSQGVGFPCLLRTLFSRAVAYPYSVFTDNRFCQVITCYMMFWVLSTITVNVNTSQFIRMCGIILYKTFLGHKILSECTKWILGCNNSREQEYIPVGCVPPALPPYGGSPWTETSWTETPLDRNPPWTKTQCRTETPLEREPPWTETSLWTESQTSVKTLPSCNFVCGWQKCMSLKNSLHQVRSVYKRMHSVECKPPACREYGLHKNWRDVDILLWPWCDLHHDVWTWPY